MVSNRAVMKVARELGFTSVSKGKYRGFTNMYNPKAHLVLITAANGSGFFRVNTFNVAVDSPRFEFSEFADISDLRVRLNEVVNNMIIELENV